MVVVMLMMMMIMVVIVLVWACEVLARLLVTAPVSAVVVVVVVKKVMMLMVMMMVLVVRDGTAKTIEHARTWQKERRTRDMSCTSPQVSRTFRGCHVDRPRARGLLTGFRPKVRVRGHHQCSVTLPVLHTLEQLLHPTASLRV